MKEGLGVSVCYPMQSSMCAYIMGGSHLFYCFSEEQVLMSMTRKCDEINGEKLVILRDAETLLIFVLQHQQSYVPNI